MSLDITDQMTAEDALRESEEKYRQLVDNLQNAVVYQLASDPDGGRRFIFVSRAVERLNEVTVEEVLTNADVIYSQVMPEYHTIVREREEAALKNLSTLHVEVQSRLPSGRVRWFEYTSTPRRRSDGLLVWDGIQLDITERKNAEEANLAFERQSLYFQRLESLGVMAGGIAHDFNNYLTAIMSHIDLARRGLPKDSPALELLETGRKACIQASDLSRQLITFSRREEPDKQTGNLSDLVHETAIFVTRGSRVKCVFDFAPDLWGAEFDHVLIRQVIHNIIINAVQAMPEGGEISISCRNCTLDEGNLQCIEAGRYIMIDIRDSGVGIPEELLTKIFDPYFTTRQTGNGLGLATAYSIVKRHKGALTVRSDSERGSVFTLFLPARPSAEKTCCTPVETAQQESARCRILVMDDEETIRDVLGMMLDICGYDCVISRNGFEAVDAYRQAMEEGSPFDAVILDLIIPGGMGGTETLRKIRELDPEVRGIVSTGYTDDPVITEYAAHGFRGILVKPYTDVELDQALQCIA